MILSKAVVSSVFLMTVFNAVGGKPQPSVIRERHVIHAPIKFKVIHHYKIKKIPILVKKHVHYHREPVETGQPVLEEIAANHIHPGDTKGFPPYFDHHSQHDTGSIPLPQHDGDELPPPRSHHHQYDGEDFPPYFDSHLPEQPSEGFPPRRHPGGHRPKHKPPPLAVRVPHDDDYEDYPADDHSSQEGYDDYDYE